MKGRLKKETVVSDLHPQIFPLSYLFSSVLRGFLQAVCCSLKKQPLQRLKAVCILPPASILFAEPSCWQHVDSRSEHAPWHADKPGGFEDEGSGPAWVPAGSHGVRWTCLSSGQPNRKSPQPCCPPHPLPPVPCMTWLASATGSSLQGEKPLYSQQFYYRVLFLMFKLLHGNKRGGR